MEEMIQIAKTNGNQIDHKELLDYFSDYELNEEAKKLLIASFVEAGIRVLGVDEAQIVSEEEAPVRMPLPAKVAVTYLYFVVVPPDEA